MRIKLDENIPHSVSAMLSVYGHDVDTVQEEGLCGFDDDRVWKATFDAERFFITQDLDFSDIRAFTPGSHQGLLLIRLRNPGRLAVFQRIKSIFDTENVESWSNCFVVSTDRKIRVNRPET